MRYLLSASLSHIHAHKLRNEKHFSSLFFWFEWITSENELMVIWWALLCFADACESLCGSRTCKQLHLISWHLQSPMHTESASAYSRVLFYSVRPISHPHILSLSFTIWKISQLRISLHNIKHFVFGSGATAVVFFYIINEPFA